MFFSYRKVSLKIFGEIFKKLRKEQNISLAQAADGVTTIATLSRWENGQTNLKFEQMVSLLNNINISVLEFISITLITPHTPFEDEVDKALQHNSSIELYNLSQKWINIYKASQRTDDLLHAATACDAYLSLTAKNIFPKSYIDDMIQVFSNVNYWSHYYIVNFGNSLSLLPSKNIYGFSMLIINNIEEIKKGGFEYFLDTVSTLLNASQILIYRSSSLAKNLLAQLDTIHLSFFAIPLKIRRDVLEQLFYYELTGNDIPLLNTLSALETLNLSELKEMFNSAYQKVKSNRTKL